MQCEDFSNLRAVILAAGLSSRMRGEHKALQPLGDTTMLGAALGAFARAGVPGVRVVTGHKNAQVADEALRHGGIPVHNPNFAQGMFTSICTGLLDIENERHSLLFPPLEEEQADIAGPDQTAASGHNDVPAQNTDTNGERANIGAVFIMPVDAALIRAESIAAMASTWLSLDQGLRQKAIIIPGFAGRCGHPPLFGADHILPLLLWQGGGQWQDQWQWRGGLRDYVRTLLDKNLADGFSNGQAPTYAPLALAASAPRLFDQPEPKTGNGGQDAVVYFVSLPDKGAGADMDTAEDLATAEAFLEATRARRDPSPEEALEWLRLSNLPGEKILHCIQVALGALRLGLAIREAGLPVDPALIVCGGLLHDVARLQKGHARAGAELLRREGWHDCATVVNAHTVLPDAMLEALGLVVRDLPVGKDEKLKNMEITRVFRPEVLYASTCVYLSDKFWSGFAPVTIEERFAIVKNHFSDNQEAINAVSHRQGIACAVEEYIGRLVGKEVVAVVRAPSDHHLDHWLEGCAQNRGRP